MRISTIIIWVNMVCYILSMLYNPIGLMLTDQAIWYTLITSIFLHVNATHLLCNMFVLFVFSDFEEVIGKKYYLCIYFAAGLMGGAFSLIFNVLPTLGASGAIMGIVAAGLINNIKKQKYSIKTRRSAPWTLKLMYIFTVIMVGLLLFSGDGNKKVNDVAHYSGFITGAIVYYVIESKEQWYKVEEDL